MFSPTAIRDLVASLNPIGNPVVPHFVFPLDNKSSSPHPRKEAFKFRDGIIIVSTPILSESNAYKCLQEACRAFGVDPPVRWDMLAITRGITATQSMEYIKNFAEVIKKRKADSDSARLSESKPHNLNYFNFPEKFMSKALNVPNPLGSMWPATPMPPSQPNVRTSDHTEAKAVFDDRDWQDRLVPSVKMEAARRRYVTMMMDAGMYFPRDAAGDDDVEHTPAPGYLLMRDGQKRTIAMPDPNGILPETNGNRCDWSRIEAWRLDIAVRRVRAPPAILYRIKKRRRVRHGRIRAGESRAQRIKGRNSGLLEIESRTIERRKGMEKRPSLSKQAANSDQRRSCRETASCAKLREPWNHR
jgi:hypothetical protein